MVTLFILSTRLVSGKSESLAKSWDQGSCVLPPLFVPDVSHFLPYSPYAACL